MKKIKIPFLTAIIAICAFSCSSDSETTEEKKPVDQEMTSGVDKPNVEIVNLDKLPENESFKDFISGIDNLSRSIKNIGKAQELIKIEKRTIEQQNEFAKAMGFDSAKELEELNKSIFKNWKNVFEQFDMDNQNEVEVSKILAKALSKNLKSNNNTQPERSARLPADCYIRDENCVRDFLNDFTGDNTPRYLMSGDCHKFSLESPEGELCLTNRFNELAIEEAIRTSA